MYERKYSGVNDRKAYPVDIVAFKDGDDVSYLNVENGELKLNGNPVGGGSGGVTSWNDLQDRPFYSEEGMVEILPATPAVDMGEGKFALMDAINGVEVGGTYTVTYNGVAYECVAQPLDDDGITFSALGNGVAVGLTFGNNEPFFMLVVPPDKVAVMGVAAQMFALDGAASVTISISAEGGTIHKLDNKYLDLAWLPTVTTRMVEVFSTTGTIGTSGRDYINNIDFDIAVGDTIAVTYNGIDYECVAKLQEGTTYFGNLAAFADDLNDTGEPFVWIKDSRQVVCKGDSNTDYTFVISAQEYVYNAMPEEFLPNSTKKTLTKFYANLSSSNADGTYGIYATSDAATNGGDGNLASNYDLQYAWNDGGVIVIDVSSKAEYRAVYYKDYQVVIMALIDGAFVATKLFGYIE